MSSHCSHCNQDYQHCVEKQQPRMGPSPPYSSLRGLRLHDPRAFFDIISLNKIAVIYG